VPNSDDKEKQPDKCIREIPSGSLQDRNGSKLPQVRNVTYPNSINYYQAVRAKKNCTGACHTVREVTEATNFQCLRWARQPSEGGPDRHRGDHDITNRSWSSKPTWHIRYSATWVRLALRSQPHANTVRSQSRLRRSASLTTSTCRWGDRKGDARMEETSRAD